MKRYFTVAGIALTALMLACGSGDDKMAAQTPDTAAKAPAAAAEAPAAAKAAAAPDETPPVAAAAEDTSKQCLALAAQQKWSEALDPCTQAAQDHPTDLRIKHAVQQAQAAAEG